MGFQFDKDQGAIIDRERGETLILVRPEGPWKSDSWVTGRVESDGTKVCFRWAHKAVYTDSLYRNSEDRRLRVETVHIAWWEAACGLDADVYLSRVGAYLTDHRHMYRSGLTQSKWRRAPELEPEWREAIR